MSMVLTLNIKGCIFEAERIKFLDHVIENGNLRPDPDKVTAMMNLEPSKDISELRFILGMINFQMKSFPNLMSLSASSRILLKK